MKIILCIYESRYFSEKDFCCGNQNSRYHEPSAHRTRMFPDESELLWDTIHQEKVVPGAKIQNLIGVVEFTKTFNTSPPPMSLN